MATSTSLPANSKFRSSLSFESRPKMLKDFLKDDSYSYSSNGFRSYLRKPSMSMVQGTKSNKISSQLLRSRLKAASSTTFAIHKASEIVINILKYLPLASVKPPSILPRSISRKLSGRSKDKNHHVESLEEDVSVKVKVKDILRWRSFRDLVEDKSTPLDRCTATTTTTGSSTTTTSSKSSSWCDSDFTAEEFPSWCYESDECFGEKGTKMAKQYLLEEGVGGSCMEATRTIDMDPKENLLFDEYEQHSPVSVLDTPFREDEESMLVFHRNLADFESMSQVSIIEKKCMRRQRIKEFESLAGLEPINLKHGSCTENSSIFHGQEEEGEDVNEAEEKAKQLQNHLFLDFFRHELTTSRKQNDDKFESELLRIASEWLSGEYEGSFEWEVEGKRETYIKEMEKGLSWNKFEDEQEEMALQFESLLLGNLVDELLADLLTH